jgi:hypothetical protein
VDSETRAYLDTARDGLRQQIRAGAEETAALRREMRETVAETGRHFDVVAESIRSDVGAVAEGVATNSEAIERLGHDFRAEMDSRFTAFHAVVGVALAEVRREMRGPGAGR